MKLWNTFVSLGFGLAVLGLALSGKADARSKLPTVCVQAQNAYKKSSSYVKKTIRTHKTFRKTWMKAFNFRKIAKKSFSRSKGKFSSSKASYSSLKSYLSGKGFAVSKSNSLKRQLQSKGYKVSGKHWLKRRVKTTSSYKVPKTNNKFKFKSNKKVKMPFSVSRVKSTKRSLTRTKRSLSKTLSKLRNVLKWLKSAKTLGLRSKAESKKARSYLKNTKSLVRKCNAILKTRRYRKLRRRKFRVQRPMPQGRRYCGGDQPVSWSRGFYYCAPCDPMASSCAGTCQFMSFGMMEQNTSNQESQLSAAESSSDPNGNIMFEIDMKTAESTKESSATQSSSTETDDALGALGF